MSAVNVDAEHFSQQGWVCVEDVVPVADCEAVVDTICDFWQVSRDGSQPAQWHRPHSPASIVVEYPSIT